MQLDGSNDASSATTADGILLKSSINALGHAWQVPGSLMNNARDDIMFNEGRSLVYYRTRVSKNISNYFDEDFWNVLVLQVGEEEPIVRHAVLALSALYEAGENSQLSDLSPSIDRHRHLMRFAIHQHNTAISILLKSINNGGVSLDVVLMSCLIFTWIEFVRGNGNDAIGHINSGLRLLREQGQPMGARAVFKQAAHILSRVQVQAVLHRSSTIDIDYSPAMSCNQSLEPLDFGTLREARYDLDGKISSALRLLRQIECVGLAALSHRCGAFPDSSCLMCIHQAHLHDFDQWKRAFSRLRERLDINTWTTDALQALYKLELSYLLISNSLNTVFATTPMLFDKYDGVYARITYLSSRILHGQILSRTTSVFKFPYEISVQGALLNVVLRCRNLPIRRKAVRLLQLCPDTEGIWQPAALVALCNWKIDTEERGRPEGALETDPLPESARLYVEGAREIVRDGQKVVAIRFYQGVWNESSEGRLHEEVVPNVSIGLARLLGMRIALLLHPASESKA
jgi:hypothetical protein